MSKVKTFVEKKIEDCTPNYNQPKYQYINGYYDAGRILVEEALKLEKEGKSHNYFYPICYSYRHYIELHLKTIIEDLELLYEKSEKLGYLKNGILLDENKVSGKLHKIHKLNDLLSYAEERIIYTQVNGEEFPKDTAKFIRQIHEKDKTGQSFRYSKSTSGKSSFDSTPYYELEELKKVMEKINNMLWAIDSHTDYYIDMAESIISFYES